MCVCVCVCAHKLCVCVGCVSVFECIRCTDEALEAETLQCWCLQLRACVVHVCEHVV